MKRRLLPGTVMDVCRAVSVATKEEPWAGEVCRTHNRQTGTLVVLLDARNGGHWAGGDDGRWIVLCDDHGALNEFRTRGEAYKAMSQPRAWCECCRRAPAAPKGKG